MPGLNGTGPMGAGPMTGGGRGLADLTEGPMPVGGMVEDAVSEAVLARASVGVAATGEALPDADTIPRREDGTAPPIPRHMEALTLQTLKMRSMRSRMKPISSKAKLMPLTNASRSLSQNPLRHKTRST